MIITLVTSNKNKLREFREVLGPEIRVVQKDLSLDELRAENNEVIAKNCAEQAMGFLDRPLLVEDSGFFVEALGGFPGVCTAYVFKRIGNRGILKLLEETPIDERICYYRTAIAYSEPGSEPVVFTGEEKGKVTYEEKGNAGWGQDPIFMPDGHDKTYGESRKLGDQNIFRQQALLKLKDYLLNK